MVIDIRKSTIIIMCMYMYVIVYVRLCFNFQGKLQMGIARGERIAQCRHIKMVTGISLPIQIDGGKQCAYM